MRKLLKSRKALSPVVAAIILIAVTVAVSIAVAAWMGALTFSFTTTEQITYTGYAWAAPSGTPSVVTYINLTIKNTGPAELSVAAVRVDGSSTGVTVLDYDTGQAVSWSKAMPKGDDWSFRVSISSNYARGTQYNFMVVTSKGTQFGPYTLTAP